MARNDNTSRRSSAIPILALVAGVLMVGAWERITSWQIAKRKPQNTDRYFAAQFEGPLDEYPKAGQSPLRGDQIPLHVQQAFIAIEDQRFPDRKLGLDFRAIARASIRNLHHLELREGASTIQQQLARMVWLDMNEWVVWRKLAEANLAIAMPLKQTKKSILADYLNRVPFCCEIFGINGAAKFFFNKSASSLSVAEGALLAAMVHAPSLHNIRQATARKRTYERAILVLIKMWEQRYLDKQQLLETLRLLPRTQVSRDIPLRGQYDLFMEYAQREVKPAADWWPSAEKQIVVTTLHGSLQREVEKITKSHLDTPEFRRLGIEAGVVVMKPTGEIVAAIGNLHPETNEENWVTQVKRPIASTAKYFTYLAAYESGYTKFNLISGEPLSINGRPIRNSSNAYPAKLTFSQALALSVNTAAVRLTMTQGVKPVIGLAKELGVTIPSRGRSAYRARDIALGVPNISLLQLTGAFAAVANGGHRVTPSATTSFPPDVMGKGVLGPKILKTQSVQAMLYSLRLVVEIGTAQNAKIPGRNVYAKTGTTDDYRDALIVGFIREIAGKHYRPGLVVGIRLGRADYGPMPGISGGNIPAKLLAEILKKGVEYGF